MGIDGAPPAPEAESSGVPRRTSAVRAIGSVVAIAVVAAGGFVVFARSQATAEPPPAGLDEEVPSALADGQPPGTVPEQIADAVEAPVLAVVRLDELSDGLEDCALQSGPIDEPELEFAAITPDGATVSLIGDMSVDFQGGFAPPMPGPAPMPGQPLPAQPVPVQPVPAPAPPPPALPPPDIGDQGPVEGAPPLPAEPDIQRSRATCTAQWFDGRWQVSSSGLAPADEFFDGGMGMSCCDSEGFSTGSSTVQIPEGTAWLVQDRGAYRLAYPVEGLEIAMLTWRFREGGFGFGGGGGGGTPVILLDADGDILEERFVGV